METLYLDDKMKKLRMYLNKSIAKIFEKRNIYARNENNRNIVRVPND